MLTPLQYRRLARLMTPLEIDLLAYIQADPERRRRNAYVHNLLVFRWWGMKLEPEEEAAVIAYWGSLRDGLPPAGAA